MPPPELLMVTFWAAGLPLHTPDMLAVTLVGEREMVGDDGELTVNETE